MSLAPKLKKRSVSTDKLLLDPNNPRLFTTEIERVPLADDRARDRSHAQPRFPLRDR